MSTGVSYLVEVSLWDLAEVHDEQMNVNGQPERSKHDNDQYQCPTGLTLLVNTATALTSAGHCGRAAARQSGRRGGRRHGRLVTGDVTQDSDREENDDDQWNKVGEREERGVQLSGCEWTGDDAARGTGSLVDHGTVLGQHGSVDCQHEDPDSDDHGDHSPGGAVLDRPGRVNDGHVANDGDEDERVDGDVGRDVDEVVHQSTCDVTERPAVSGEHVGRRRRDDNDERQVGHGQVQQQEVGHRAHALLRQNDVDDEAVPDDSEDRDDAVQNRNGDFVQDEIEVDVGRQSPVSHVTVGNTRRHRWRHSVICLVPAQHEYREL